MINYFKYTSGNAFTLSGVDYSGFVNIDDGKPFTGRVKNSLARELSSKDNFLSRSILKKREFDNSPTTSTTNKVKSLEYSPRNVLSNDFLKKNFNILYENNLSLFSLGQVYNSSAFDTSNFKDETSFGGFFGLSSTTIDDRNDDTTTLKDFTAPYQIDPFKGADKGRFPDLFELDNTKKAYVETFEDGFIYTAFTGTKTIAFSGSFTGEIGKIKNASIQQDLASVKRLDVDKANGLIYSPTLESNDLNYTNIYDRDIYRACTRLKLVDKIKTSNHTVINNNISFGKNYKVAQVIEETAPYTVKLEISRNNTSEVLATIPISSLDNAEYVRVESRYTDDLLLIVAKPLSNTQSYNAYFIDIPEFIINGVIPVPKIIPRVSVSRKYKTATSKDAAFTVFGTPTVESSQQLGISQTEGYYFPLFENEFAVGTFSLSEPREITLLVRDPITNVEVEKGPFYYASDYINLNPVINGDARYPTGLLIYYNDNSIIDLDVSFSDYDSNLFSLKDDGNITERMITNPRPVTSLLNNINLLLPPDILFNSPFKFNTNSWKFNTNLLESNQISTLNTLTDTFNDKTYEYFHNIGRLYFSTDNINNKRISLVPANLESFFNPNIFDTICETSLGVNLNVLIQDILRDTINIYNNFTRIPKADEIKRYYINENEVSKEEYEEFQNLSREEQLNRYGILVPSNTQGATSQSVTSRVDVLPWEPPSDEAISQTLFGFSEIAGPEGGFFISLGPSIEMEVDIAEGRVDYQGISDSIEVSRREYSFFLAASHAERIEKYFDIVGRVGLTKYYINENEVSKEEYEEFQNLSREEQLNRYGDTDPQSTTSQLDNRTVSSRVENTGGIVFNDFKIPTPLEIDTRNFYFHSNESVNYLSINRIFSKLFELQKTIYDSILSS
jgi:hypothetical protein